MSTQQLLNFSSKNFFLLKHRIEVPETFALQVSLNGRTGGKNITFMWTETPLAFRIHKSH